MEVCKTLATKELDTFRDDLIAQVHRASTLQVTDHIRHLRPIIDGADLDPALAAKRLGVAEVVVYVATAPGFRFTGDPTLTLGLPRPSHVLEQKLQRGGISDEAARMRDLGRDAEYNLLEDTARRPEEYPALLRQIEQKVLGECSEAYLRARQRPAPYGAVMTTDPKMMRVTLAKDD